MSIRIGTRRSKLALAQTELAEKALRTAFPELVSETVHITTKGDKVLDRPLTEIGGKGVFIAEIERALLDDEIDIAVHSAKDLPLRLGEGTEIGAVLPRASCCDTLVMGKAMHQRITLDREAAYCVGTGSQRRRNGVAKLFPNVVFADIRGNVDTRLDKLHRGEYDAIVLAQAGLVRLGLDSDSRFRYLSLPPETVVPAPCQGVIAVQRRTGELVEELERICCPDTLICFETEREVLRLLDAGCSTPAGALAQVRDGHITLTVTLDQMRILTETAPVGERLQLVERLVRKL